MNADSIAYYEIHADDFVASTINADVTSLYEKFEKHISAGCRILDLGCGSGRDSRYFSNKGYDVIAVDPSPAMCAQTEKVADVPVYIMKAEELAFEMEFDAVWACASLLHVHRSNQVTALRAICRVLRKGGILYCSWKYGNCDRTDNGRQFIDLDEKALERILLDVPELELVENWVTVDIRQERKTQKWLNALIRKVAE